MDKSDLSFNLHSSCHFTIQVDHELKMGILDA